MKNILSIDGGGVRTYIPLRILNEIEKRTNMRIYELFDYFTGVSASSLIISLLLLKDENDKPKYDTNEILNIFTQACSDIFYYSYFSKFYTLFGLIAPKYSNKNFVSLLDKHFGSSVLSDLLKPACILSYDLNYSKPYFFNSHDEPHLKIKDCILASTAAPTYFYPYSFKLNSSDNNEHLFVDGGVITNNPAEICFLKSTEYFPNSDFMTLSIGTGHSLQLDDMKKYRFGLYTWSYNILDTIFSANSNSQSAELSILNKLLVKEESKSKFHRIDIGLKDFIYLDDIYCFDRMKKIMDDWILKNDLDINRLCEKLIYNVNHKNSFIIN